MESHSENYHHHYSHLHHHHHHDHNQSQSHTGQNQTHNEIHETQGCQQFFTATDSQTIAKKKKAR